MPVDVIAADFGLSESALRAAGLAGAVYWSARMAEAGTWNAVRRAAR